MQLFTNPFSPFCRKIEVILHEVGQSDAMTMTTVSGNPNDVGTLPITINPVGKIPTLVRDDGPAIYDSRVISRYLDDRFSAGLYPAAGLWDILTLEATGDAICDAAVLIVYEARTRPAEIRHEPFVTGQWAKIERSLDMLETRGMGLLSGPLNAGQVSVGCALGYLDLRHGERNWRAARPQLAAWFERFSTRPSMLATRPPAA